MREIWQQAQALEEEIIACRRDLHRYPETGWTEFRTASMVIGELRRLGFTVAYGAAVVDAAGMMGVPPADELARCSQRAVSEGADAALVTAMAGGLTGVVGILRGGAPGRTVALRFDMDANALPESRAESHRPLREGFASCHAGAMHACGHDGHVSIGLAVAKLLAANRQQLCGTVKLIFQPAEEGVRGAYAMVRQGVADDVDYFFSGHLGIKATTKGSLACLADGFLATTKLDAVFTGSASHAGLAPEQGRNALLAAAQASISLHTIARHGQGASRINVGVLRAGSGRNVVPEQACMQLETRGATTGINDFMVQEAERMLQAAAALYGVKVAISRAGSAPGCTADPGLGHDVAELARASGQFNDVIERLPLGGSEDCAWFMERVQQRGGRAAYLMYGTELAAGHHNSQFDFDESCLWRAAGLLAILALRYARR